MNGETLKFYRRMAGLSQTTVGKAIGKSFYVIYAMEKGRRAIRPDEAEIFRRLLNIPPDEPKQKPELREASNG